MDGANRAVVYREFPDKSMVMKAPLNVNPDGGQRSYTVGDHGFTYIANGLMSKKADGWKKCEGAECRSAFLEIERLDFGPGSPEMCSFAMEVEPLHAGRQLIDCGSGSAKIIGNGKGRLKRGAMVETVTGESLQTYVSMTSLKHTIDGKAAYLDSETVPIVVTPDTKLLGRVVLVRGEGFHDTYGVIGDYGKKFGEGSIALHQLLLKNQITPQKSGPIPPDRRCGVEEKVEAPFLSRPDLPGDDCKAGHSVASATDIRAYKNIDKNLEFLILPVWFPGTEKTTTTSVTVTNSSIAQLAAKAGYSEDKINQMFACLP